MDINRTMITIFEIMSEGILIIDKDGCVIYGNKAYCDFLDMDLNLFIGKPLRSIRPGAILPNVLTKKKPILQAPRQEHGDTYFVNMYPIFENDEVIGGISIVTFIHQAKGIKKLIDDIMRQNKKLINRISEASNAYYTFDSIISVSSSTSRITELAKKAAAADLTVLLQSESGTGKELYAQAIHNASARSGGIFLSVNCANFNSNMLESELFGYAGGAFTGAKQGGNIGLFEAASGGTIFLDEISETELSLQAKLLRVLQERRIRPVGSVEERTVDVRIIAACNVDLKQYVNEGKFRADLYYRLNVFPINIPPLRERKEDIELLANVFLEELSRKFKRNICIEDDVMTWLTAYHWPGNVRELRNVLEFMACLANNGVINESMLPDNIKDSSDTQHASLQQRVKIFEKNEIMRLLAINGSDMNGKKKTATQLGISMASLYNKINQ